MADRRVAPSSRGAAVGEHAGRCVIVCRECADEAGDVLVMPFDSAQARGRWAAEHTVGTGHDRWFCVDGWPGPEAVEAGIERYDALADQVARMAGDRRGD